MSAPPFPNGTEVKIFVRKVSNDRDDDDQRRISIRLPHPTTINPVELLDLGLAIDGNEAVFEVGPGGYDNDGVLYEGPLSEERGRTLAEALLIQQRALVKFIRDKGHTPQFA